MLKQILAFCAIGFTAVSLMPAEGKAQSAIQNTVFLGCSVPKTGADGMSVYSYEAYSSAGKWIATDLAATKDDVAKLTTDVKCSAAINKMMGSSKGCPAGMTWMPFFTPNFNSIGSTGYALNLFSFTCQRSGMPPA